MFRKSLFSRLSLLLLHEVVKAGRGRNQKLLGRNQRAPLAPQNPSCPMIKVLYWNYSGIVNSPTISALIYMITSHTSDVNFLSEPISLFFPSSHLHPYGYDVCHTNQHPSTTFSTLWCLSKSTFISPLSYRYLISTHYSLSNQPHYRSSKPPI